jgi:protein ImuA
MLSPSSAPSSASLYTPPTPALPSLQGLAAQGRVWRAHSLGQATAAVVPSGFAALDAELPGGGWGTGQLNEILSPPGAMLAWRLLAPALRGWLGEPAAAAPNPGTSPRTRRTAAAGRLPRQLLLIGPPHAPGLLGLAAAGLAPGQIVWIAAETAHERLWATEQALRTPGPTAVMAWLPEVQTGQPALIRRLQCSAQGGEALCFVLRPEAARQQASAAPLRTLLAPGPGFALQLQLLKRRGPAHEQPLRLRALPAGWERLLSERILQERWLQDGPRPAITVAPATPAQEARDALDRAALAAGR